MSSKVTLNSVSVNISDSENSSMKGTIVKPPTVWTSTSDSLFEAARKYDHKKLFKILQQENSDVNSRDLELKTALHVVLENGFLGHLNEDNMVQCVVILRYFDADVNLKDRDGNTPLSHAIGNTFHRCTTILLEAGAHCSANLATQMAHQMPEILLETFNSGISVDEDSKDGVMIKLDWRPVLRFGEESTFSSKRFKDQQKETHFLYTVLDVKADTRKKILDHPLVEAFLHFKNTKVINRFRWFYIFSVLYPILYGLFIYFLYFDRCAFEKSTSDLSDDNQTDVSSSTTITSKTSKTKCEITAPITAGSALLLVTIIIYALIELYLQFRVDRRYLRSWRTWVLRATIVVIAVTLWPGLQYEVNYSITFQYPIASLGIFLAWVMFLIQVGSYQKFSIYLDMLVKILMSVIKITIMFLPLFIGFFMGFNLMFADMEGVFSYIMMTVDVGAVAYDNLINDAKEDALWFEALAYTFCVGFVIIIVIVFMNFLLALSISDVDTLKGQAKMARKSRQIQNMFLIDLIDPNAQIIPKQDTTEDIWFYKYNPMSLKTELPEEIRMKITLLLKSKKLNQVMSETKKMENKRIQNVPDNPNSEMTKVLMRRIEELEIKLDEVSRRMMQ